MPRPPRLGHLARGLVDRARHVVGRRTAADASTRHVDRGARGAELERRWRGPRHGSRRSPVRRSPATAAAVSSLQCSLSRSRPDRLLRQNRHHRHRRHHQHVQHVRHVRYIDKPPWLTRPTRPEHPTRSTRKPRHSHSCSSCPAILMRPSGARSRSPMGSSRTRSKASRSCSAGGARSSPTTWASARRARRSSRCGTSRRAAAAGRLPGIGQAKLGARDRRRRAGRLDPGDRGNGADLADGRVGHRQLRHPRTAPRRPAARAVGGARVRRSALPEEPHQRAEQAVTPADDHAPRRRRRRSPCSC